MKRNCRDDGCCCIFDEDGETQLEWCRVHALMRDRIRELEAKVEAITYIYKGQRELLDECERALLYGIMHLEAAYLYNEADVLKATLAKLRGQEKADE